MSRVVNWDEEEKTRGGKSQSHIRARGLECGPERCELSERGRWGGWQVWDEEEKRRIVVEAFL